MILLRTTLLSLALLAALALPSRAQDAPLLPDEQSKLDGDLQLMLTRGAAKSAPSAGLTPLLHQTMMVDDAGVARFPVVLRADDAQALRAAGLPINATIGRFSTAHLTADEIRAAASLSAVRSIEAAGLAESHNDTAAREVGARTLNSGAVNNTSYSGQGVLTCVLDTGIDVNHGDFQDADGNTRILYLWDQTMDTEGQTPEDRSTTLAGLDYGTEYTAADIDAGNVAQTDTDGHGTHVAGTVASSGNAVVLDGSQPTPQHRGMAPEADLIIVKGGNGTFTNTNIINAMSYCGQVADDLGQPLVMNMSLGDNSGPHDGTSLIDLAVDAFTDATPTNLSSDPGTAPNRIVVTSAGNKGGGRSHVTGTIPFGDTGLTPWTVASYSPESGVVNDFFATQVWFDSAEDVTIVVRAPNGTDADTLAASGTSAQVVSVGTPSGAIYIESGVSADNGHRYVDARVFDWQDTSQDTSVTPSQEIVPAEGTWQIELRNDGPTATTYHGWTWAQTVPGGYDNGDDAYTVDSPGTSNGAITVASHVHRWYWGNDDGPYIYISSTSDRDLISRFSSPGPRRDGALKPDISAPGQGMISAYSQDMPPVSATWTFGPNGLHRMTQGTSVSSPVVAGSVALLLQAATEQGISLTGNEVRDLLTRYATVDEEVLLEGTVPNTHFGHGKLDILGPVLEVLGGQANREVLTYHENVGFGSTAPFTIGTPGSTDRAAVRFTPSIDGVVTGGVITPWYDGLSGAPPVAINTTDLLVEIWSDDGTGAPDQPLGPAVAVPAETLVRFSPNGFGLESASVPVMAGTDYHMVFSLPTAGETITTKIETGSTPSGRTQVFDGTSWSAAAGNLVVRTEVSATTGVGTLPVELASFEATTVPGEAAVRLAWRTLSETDNAGFGVEYRSVGGGAAQADVETAWTRAGFVQGAGTTTEPQAYTFTLSDLAAGAYEVRLRQVDTDGAATYSEPVAFARGVQGTHELAAPYPNPFRQRARLSLAVAEAQEVTVTVYNVLGQRVATLHDGPLAPGRAHNLVLDAAGLASGVYFVRATGDGFQATRRVTLVR